MRKSRFLLMLLIAQAACLAAGLVAHTRQQMILGKDKSQGTATVQDSILLGTNVFVWTFGLQATVAWILIGRLFGRHEAQEGVSREETYLKTQELIRTRDAVIFGLAKLAESRDPDTGQHLERIAAYSTKLALAARRHPKLHDLVSLSFAQSIGVSSALHDIGKVGIPDHVLLKAGPLNEKRQPSCASIRASVRTASNRFSAAWESQTSWGKLEKSLCITTKDGMARGTPAASTARRFPSPPGS